MVVKGSKQTICGLFYFYWVLKVQDSSPGSLVYWFPGSSSAWFFPNQKRATRSIAAGPPVLVLQFFSSLVLPT
jgi:hypothetical protein